MSVDDYIERRKRELGITSGGTKPAVDEYIQTRKMDLGVIPDTRKKDSSINDLGGVGDNSYGPTFTAAIETPKKSSWNGLLDNPIVHGVEKGIKAIDVLSQDFAKYATPDAPMFTKDGKLDPNMTARQRFMLDNPQKSTGNESLDNSLDFVGKAGSFYTPGGGLSNVAGLSNSAGSLVGKIAPNLASSLGGRVAQTAAREAITGAPLGAGQSLATGHDSLKDTAEGALQGATFGGALGAAGPLIGKAFQRSKIGQAFTEWQSAKSAPDVQTSPTLALPEGRPRGNINNAQAPDVIYGEGKTYTPEPLGLPEPSIAPATRARVETRPNIYTQKLENLFEQANQTKFTPGRESEEIESMWSQMAGPEDPPLDKLIDLAYPNGKPKVNAGSLQQAKELQQAREVAGVPNKVKSMSDRYIPFSGDAGMPRERVGFKQPEVEITPPKNNFAPVNSTKNPILKAEVQKSNETLDDIIQTKEPRIRDKIYSALDEAEQAARARLKAKKNTLSSLPLDQYADHAVILAAKIGKGGIKLADATEYLVKEFGEEIKPHVQSIYKKARGIVQDTERRATKQAQEARDFNAADAGDAGSFRGKVSRDVKKAKTPFAKTIESLRTQWVDDVAPLEGLEKRVRGKVSSAEDSLYKSARMFKGVPEKANQIVKDRLAPVVNGIEKQGYSSTDLGDYALAVHAKDVNARDIKSGFTNKEIDDVISRLGTPEMEAARKELMKINDDMLGELAKNGVINWDLVGTLRERYPNYMPLFRAFDDESVNFADGLSKSLANVTAPIKGLKGSERQVVDPLENMVKNIFQSTNAAERNKVSTQLSNLAKDDPDGLFIRKLEPDEEVGRKNVVSVLEGGKKIQYEVEPEVYKAMLNLDQESSNTLIKILQKPASILRAGATLTPEFSLRNPLRDVVQAFVTSNSGFNPLIDFPVGLIQSISKGKLYKKWVDELGAYGNIISNDRQVHKEALERVLKEPASKKFVNIINGKALVSMLRAISDTTESATKVGEFRAALRQGQSLEEAAYRSRDLMDFGRAGSSVRQTNKIVAFLNANIQGKSKLIRAFKENPAGFSARAFAAVTAPTIGVFIMQKKLANEAQKKTIDEAPAWMTDSFWLVPVPGTDQVARVPKPFDIGALFSNLPERALKYVYNNDKESFDGFAKKALADSALPGMISGLTPFIEGMANYSFFRGGPIIPQREDGINYADQYDVNTTESAKGLAKVAGKITGGKGMMKNFSSPRIMDNTIKGLTAGLGGYATSTIDVLLDKFNVTDNPSKPAKGISQWPLAKAFLVNPNQSGKSTEKLYDLKTDLTTDKGSAKLRGEPFRDSGKLDFINNQTESMSGISKQIRLIENSKLLTPAQKRDQMDKLTKQRNEIAIQSVKKLKGAPK